MQVRILFKKNMEVMAFNISKNDRWPWLVGDNISWVIIAELSLMHCN